MKNNSIWQEEIKKDNYYELKENREVDVLIIGGGITGISTAYHLSKSNLNICVVEKNNIASGITSKTTGKLTYLQGLIYSNIANFYSKEVAKKYYDSQKEAIKLVEDIIEENNIDCNFTKQKSYLFASFKEEIEKIKKEKTLLEEFGVKVNEIKTLPIDIHSYYGISVTDTAYFHPVKYVNELAKICSLRKVKIFENTNICELKKIDNGYICYTTNNKKIIAKKVICACNYPFFLFPYFFPIKGHIERSYISASKVDENKDVSGINTLNNATSFRFYKNNKNKYLIYLKGSHNLAFKYNIKDNFKPLINDLQRMNLNSDYLWCNEDIITNDYLPYIGEIDSFLYIATGYNTWGMTNGSIAGKILSDILLNKENKYIELFNPKRVMPFANIVNITYDLFSSIKPFLENRINKNKNFYQEKVLFTKKDGKNIAIYIDERGNKHIVYNTCPHMKCSLIFNEIEKTWDCPCHSSRFDIDGKAIKGPSAYNISYQEKE